MVHGYFDSSKIDFIFFDKGGTIGFVEKREDRGIPRVLKIMEIAGYSGDPEHFRTLFIERTKKYKQWSFENCYEDTVQDMSTKWLFFDAPDKEAALKHADMLVRHNANIKGDRVMDPDAAPVIKGLKKRGYRVGLVSNTVSSTMLPEEMASVDVWDDMEVAILSSDVRIKKPNPEIFRMACEKADIAPEKCVYIGDQPNRDVEGPRKAGFAGVILLKTDAYDPEKDTGPLRAPDAAVDKLTDLFELFPSRV